MEVASVSLLVVNKLPALQALALDYAEEEEDFVSFLMIVKVISDDVKYFKYCPWTMPLQRKSRIFFFNDIKSDDVIYIYQYNIEN